MSWAIFTKTVILTTVPALFDKAMEYLFGDPEKEVQEAVTEKRSLRKKSDRSHWTQFQFDYVNKAFIAFKEHNKNQSPGNKMTQIELVEKLNAKMGTDKGRTAMAKIWDGTIKRESLSIGKPYFTYDI